MRPVGRMPETKTLKANMLLHALESCRDRIQPHIYTNSNVCCIDSHNEARRLFARVHFLSFSFLASFFSSSEVNFGEIGAKLEKLHCILFGFEMVVIPLDL